VNYIVIDVIDRGCYVTTGTVIELINFSLTESWQITYYCVHVSLRVC